MRYSARLVSFLVLINLLVLGLDAASLKSGFDQYERTAFAATKNVTDLLIEQLGEEFDAVDKALLVVADEFQRQSAAGFIDHTALTQHLRRHLSRNAMLTSLNITDARGGYLVGSNDVRQAVRFDGSERDYFDRQISSPDIGLIISKPMLDKVSGQWGLVFSRRLASRDGTFAGVVFGVMSLEHIKSCFSKLWVGPHGAIALRDDQRRLIVRVPYNPSLGGMGSIKTSTDFSSAFRNSPLSGSYISGTTGIDGIPRLHAYGKLPNFPFIVNVGMAEQDYLAPWREDLSQRALFSSAFALISALGGGMLLLAWRRREQTLQDLRHSEARTRNIVDAALDGMVHLDANGTIIGWNPSAEQLFGWPKRVAIGKKPHELCGDVHVINEDEKGLLPELALRNFQTMPRSRLESVARHKDGHAFPVELSIAPIGTDDRREYSVFVRDITASREQQTTARELQRSQESFRLAMEAGQEGLWDWDIASGGGYFSPTYFKLLGYANLELVVTGSNWLDQIHPDDRQRVNALYQDCIESRTQELAVEFRMLTKRGNYKWILGRATAVSRNADGTAKRVISTYQDIGERKAAEDAMLVAKTEAEAANNAKSRFLAAASHDLRQPLSAIGLYLDVLMARNSPSDAPLLNNIGTCIGSLNTLLTDLLDISRLDAGVVAPTPIDYPVADLMSKLLAVHGPAARENGLQLRCRPSDLYARTDPVLMARVVGNLVANAIRYTQHGGVLIACRRHQGSVWIEVWDTGIGIPADKTQLIFEEYYQLAPNQPSRSEHSIGSGLGLAIVAKAAVLLDVRIRVHSRVGKGSMFAVELPLGRRCTSAQRETISERHLRIAVVDDNINVLKALSAALESQGHHVVAANSKNQLLRRLDGHAPDIVIADYHLQEGETGMDVIEAARSRFEADLPALVITGNTLTVFLSRMATQGVVVQHKPFRLDDLLAKVMRLTERRRLQAQAG